MKIESVKDELELTDDSVIIRKRGVANTLAAGLNGDRAIPISTITAIQLKLGGWMPGYILFSYAGSKPFNGGLIDATQDPDAFIFNKALNGEIQSFKEKVELAMRASKQPNSSGSASQSLSDELRKLVALKDEGALTQDEFTAAKKRLLV
ncbi:MAG TPA: SHOCT domain-containing protein [Rhodocyclaceae bacterium]|nr:SHOCT domain-containing protein [Rhodocyclaceae bacterium]